MASTVTGEWYHRTLLTPPPKPWALRAILGASHTLGFDRVVGLDPDALLSQAIRTTGLEDFGPDDGWREGLDRVVQSAEQDARLSLLGRVVFRRRLIQALQTRLLRLHHARPSEPILPPMIVLGLPRSGTTYLHRLLAAVRGARALKMWEVQTPYPLPRGPDRRRSEIDTPLWMMRMAAPDLMSKHPFGADEPEECQFLHDDSFRSLTFWILGPTHGYLAWCIEQDGTETYRGYRQHLEWFQRQHPAERLTLKAPVHTRYLDALRTFVPDAMIVQTHRDPAVVSASVNSLFTSIHAMVSEDLDLERMVESNLHFMEASMRRSLTIRDTIPASAIVDVHYDDIVADPVGTVRRIHAHFDLPFETEDATRVQQFATAEPQGKHGVHRYTTADLGMTEEELRDRFRPYIDRFLTPPSRSAVGER